VERIQVSISEVWQ